jgi:hypothetical protein
MKANLVYGDAGQVLDNYLNINPYGEEEGDVKVGGVQNLDEHIDNGELEELIAVDVLEYIPTNKIADTLSNWVSKLKVGGKLTLGFVEARLKGREFGNYRMALEDFNAAIHGSQEKPYMIKRTSLTAMQVIDHMVKAHTVQVVQKRLNNEYATVIFERVS